MSKFFRSAADFRRWLRAHHATANELSVGFYRQHLGRGLTYPEAVDAALCFGWIDGVRRRINEEAYSNRFSPRKRGSVWSVINIRRAKELEAAGLMAPAGLEAFHERDERKTNRYSYERAEARFDAQSVATLRANRKAAAFFTAQPPGYKRLMTFWVMSAKKPETRKRRLDRLIASSAQGLRLLG